MGRAANQNVNDSSEFTVTGSHLIDLAEEASLTGGPNIIRHTVRTWLVEGGVPDAEAEASWETKLKVALPASATFTDVPNACRA